MPELWGEVDYNAWNNTIVLVGDESDKVQPEELYKSISLPEEFNIVTAQDAITGLNYASDVDESWIFLMDTDVTLPYDTYFRLRSNGLGITSALVKPSNDSDTHSLFKHDSEDKYKLITDYTRGDIVESDMIEMSCLVTNSFVLSDITPIDDSLTHEGVSKLIRRHGYSMYVDTGVQVVDEGGEFI